MAQTAATAMHKCLNSASSCLKSENREKQVQGSSGHTVKRECLLDFGGFRKLEKLSRITQIV